MKTEFPILYHQGKTGAVVSWNLWTEDDTIYTEWGQIDGKKQLTSKKVTGKNIGRANETTPEEQAVLEATSMHTNKLERKYSLSIEAAKKPVFLPMLAHDYRKQKKKPAFSLDCQPKIDGCRCLAHWSEDTVELLSRSGKVYSLPHISKELETILPANRVFDGELYIHNSTLQQINRLVKKYRPGDTEKLEYWVYDTFSSITIQQPWLVRKTWLDLIFKDIKPKSKIKKLECTTVNNEEELEETLAKHLETGYEGSILRTLSGLYLLGHRSRDLLKVKPFYDAEYSVIGFKDGIGRYEGCAIFKCVTEEGKEFDVNPKGTLEEKKAYFTNGESYIGRKLTVQYNDLTEDNIPQFPVGLGFRLDQDLPA